MNYPQIQQQANQHFQDRRYGDSIAFYERCIEINPTELSNYWYLGIASLLAGNELLTQTVWMSVFIQASEEEADVWTADLVRVIERVAFKCLQTQCISEAKTLYLKIQEISPDYANGYLGLGKAYLENGKYQEAIKTLKKSLELNPNLASAHHDLGICFQKLHKYQDAIGNFKQATALKRDYISAFYHLGFCLVATGDYQQAIINFQSVLKLSPKHLNAHIYLADCLHKTKQIDAAIKWFQKASDIAPNSVLALSGLAVCAISTGELEKAQALLHEALKLAPDIPVLHYNLGCCFRNFGQLDLAIDSFNKAIELKPDWSDAKQFINKIKEAIDYCPKVKQGFNVWDAMLFKDEDCYRLLYLQGDSRANPSWIVGEMAMAVSSDLKHWEYKNVILHTDPHSDWEDGRILAGSLYKENGIYYLFYSAASSQDILEERIGLATSLDCITWTKREKPFLEKDNRLYGSYPCLFNEKSNKQTPWRDPYIVKDIETGKYYMFVTTSFKEGNYSHKGCIGLAVADRIDGNYEILPPVVLPLLEGTKESIFVEMERPQIIHKNDKYHLFCSTNIININPKWIAKVGRDRISNSSLYWFMADKITGPFEPVSVKPIVKGSEHTGLYATNFVKALDGRLFAVGNEGTSKTLEVSTRFPVIWEGDHLEIIVDRES